MSDKAGRVIDVAQDGPRKGSLIIWDGYNGDNQAFGVVQDGADYFLKCRQNKAFLTVENANDGARVFLSAQPTQQSRFRLDETSSGSRKFIIYTFCGKVLDLFQGIKDNGTPVIQWTYNGNSNQVWYLNDPKDISSSSSELEVWSINHVKIIKYQNFGYVIKIYYRCRMHWSLLVLQQELDLPYTVLLNFSLESVKDVVSLNLS